MKVTIQFDVDNDWFDEDDINNMAIDLTMTRDEALVRYAEDLLEEYGLGELIGCEPYTLIGVKE